MYFLFWRFQNEYNKVAIVLRVVQFWSKIKPFCNHDFVTTCLILDQNCILPSEISIIYNIQGNVTRLWLVFSPVNPKQQRKICNHRAKVCNHHQPIKFVIRNHKRNFSNLTKQVTWRVNFECNFDQICLIYSRNAYILIASYISNLRVRSRYTYLSRSNYGVNLNVLKEKVKGSDNISFYSINKQ